jgi:hypothetical protein
MTNGGEVSFAMRSHRGLRAEDLRQIGKPIPKPRKPIGHGKSSRVSLPICIANLCTPPTTMIVGSVERLREPGSFTTMTLYNTAEDCQWLRDTALRGYDVPDFAAFTITGNEDCPLTIDLYTSTDPSMADYPIRYTLLVDPHSNLSRYWRNDEDVPARMYQA